MCLYILLFMQVIAKHKYYVLLDSYNVIMNVINAKLTLQKYLMV